MAAHEQQHERVVGVDPGLGIDRRRYDERNVPDCHGLAIAAGNLAARLKPLIVAYSVQWFGSWNVPLYLMGALFLLGAVCWTLIDPRQPVFAEAAIVSPAIA